MRKEGMHDPRHKVKKQQKERKKSEGKVQIAIFRTADVDAA